MDYKESIAAVNAAYTAWMNADLRDDARVGLLFDNLHWAKRLHRLTFGSLQRVDGVWI